MWTVFVLSVVAMTTATPSTGFIGTTVDPLDYTKGENVFDLSQQAPWINVVPTPQSTLNMTVVTISTSSSTHYDGVSSVSADASVNIADVFKVSGSFSQTSTNVYDVVETTSLTATFINASTTLYTISADMFNGPPSGDFIGYLKMLVACRQAGDVTKYNQIWPMFVENFPMLVVNGYTLGGMIVSMDTVSSKYYQSTATSTSTGSASASVSFATLFSLSVRESWDVTQTEINSYTSAVSTRVYTSVGGPFIDNMNISQWQSALSTNPGILGYTVTLTSSLITPEYTGLDAAIVGQIQTEYIDVYTEYIAANTHLGCTNSTAANYNRTANLDDGSCRYSGPQSITGTRPQLIPIVIGWVNFTATPIVTPTQSPSHHQLWVPIMVTIIGVVVVIGCVLGGIYIYRRHGYQAIDA